MSSISQLNLDQRAAAYKIQTFLKDPYTPGEVFTLTGGPGTGKTFMLKTVLEAYKGHVQAATVSHAAKVILQESLGSRVECVTLAKLLGLTMTIDETGFIRFVEPTTNISTKVERPNQFVNAGLLIIDEVSQIEDKIYDYIRHEANLAKVRIIAVGDPYQLPPVDQEDDSKFFNHIDSTLTIPMRFQGPIANLAAIYRKQIDSINSGGDIDKWALNTYTMRQDTMSGETGYQFKNKLESIIELAANDIVTHPDTTSYARILAFRNESVAAINKLVRNQIYGVDLQQFEPNELVICNGGYSTKASINDGSKSIRIPILYNGQVLRIKSHKNIIGPEEVPCVQVQVSNFPSDGIHPIFVVDHSPEGQLAYDKMRAIRLQEAKKATSPGLARAAWHRYYAFTEQFAVFDYCYAVNLYKAQGQTLNNVYVCEGEVMSVKPLTWKQKFQALYVAMTRAKEKLFIYNKEF